MNYYERVQRSIDFIEAHLDQEITPELAAREAYMSTAAYYRIFFALTGFTVMAYVRLRRVALAARRLIESDAPVLDVALDTGFGSPESFTRAFKQSTGLAPTLYRRAPTHFAFERIDLMERYFEVQDPALLERYPDIKVLKELPPMRVAYYRHISATPELDAGKVLFDYVNRTGLGAEENGTRYFGFNNPNPTDGNSVYGYEVWATLPEGWVVDDPLVKEKQFGGGLYAVTSAPNGPECPPYWKRLGEWVGHSRYEYGPHQWLEEHLWKGGPSVEVDVARLDLYMPIRPKGPKRYPVVDLPDVTVASLRLTGPRAREEGRETFRNWAREQGIWDGLEQRRVFAFYDWQREGSEAFYYEICVTLADDEAVRAPFEAKRFAGGRYAVDETTMSGIGSGWSSLMRWADAHPALTYGCHQWFEEYRIRDGRWDGETEARLHLAVRDR